MLRIYSCLQNNGVVSFLNCRDFHQLQFSFLHFPPIITYPITPSIILDAWFICLPIKWGRVNCFLSYHLLFPFLLSLAMPSNIKDWWAVLIILILDICFGIFFQIAYCLDISYKLLHPKPEGGGEERWSEKKPKTTPRHI